MSTLYVIFLFPPFCNPTSFIALRQSFHRFFQSGTMSIEREKIAFQSNPNFFIFHLLLFIVVLLMITPYLLSSSVPNSFKYSENSIGSSPKYSLFSLYLVSFSNTTKLLLAISQSLPI